MTVSAEDHSVAVGGDVRDINITHIEGAPRPTGSGHAVPDDVRPELESLHRQLTEARENLCLIQERKSAFVMDTDVPLNLIKQERRTIKRIEELERRIRA
jgi:hypothetical protein